MEDLPDARLARHRVFNNIELQILRGAWTTGTRTRFEGNKESGRRGGVCSLYGVSA